MPNDKNLECKRSLIVIMDQYKHSELANRGQEFQMRNYFWSPTYQSDDLAHVQWLQMQCHWETSQFITQEWIGVGSWNLVEGLCMWPAMRDHCRSSKGQGHITYQEQECYNLAAGGHINFTFGGW